MNLQHIVKINSRLHEIRQATGSKMILGSGKQYAYANLATGKLLVKHVITGKFKSLKIK